MSAASREREAAERQKLLRKNCKFLPEPDSAEFDRLYTLFREHHPKTWIVLDGFNGQPVVRVIQ